MGDAIGAAIVDHYEAKKYEEILVDEEGAFVYQPIHDPTAGPTVPSYTSSSSTPHHYDDSDDDGSYSPIK